jgi:hypothetical protein
MRSLADAGDEAVATAKEQRRKRTAPKLETLPTTNPTHLEDVLVKHIERWNAPAFRQPCSICTTSAHKRAKSEEEKWMPDVDSNHD